MTPRILVNEDSEIDLKLLEAEFNRAKFVCELRNVSTREAFVQHLHEFRPDLIISDYYLSGFNALDALGIVKKTSPDTPIIILTNALNEETAVECMKSGATDYILKNRLPRLVAVLNSTLERQRLARENARIHREHEQLFRLTPDLFCLATLDGSLQVVNPAWTIRLGFKETELITRPLFTLVHPDDRHALDSWWTSLVSSGQTVAPFATLATPNASPTFECRLVHKEKGFRYIQWSAKPYPSDNKVYAYGYDVTEWKHAEVALRESEARFRRMADSAPVYIWMSDTSKAYVYFNQPWLEFTGKKLNDELGAGWTDDIHPEDRERSLQAYEESFAARVPFRTEYRLRRRDGHYRWVVSHGTPRYDDQGNFAGFIGSCFDVTDQHEVEAHLAYRAIKQAALASFGRFALAQHTFAELSQEATRLVADTLRIDRSAVLAIAEGDSLQLTAFSGPPLSDLPGSLGQVAEAALHAERAMNLSEDPRIFPAGALLTSLGLRSGVAVPVGSAKSSYGFLTALSEHDRLFNREAIDFMQGLANILSTVHQRERAEAALQESEQKLLQSQKMEAVGLLAGGVAHDFNNLLTAIRCYGDILHEDLATVAPELRSKAGEILKATARATALVRQLLAFSRKQVLQPEYLDLNYVANDLRDLIRSLLSENISLEMAPSETPVTIEADRSQIEQVIINLAINARDAMPQGGSLTLRTAHRVIKEGDNPDLKPGRYAEFSVSDTGMGISDEVKAKIFQPFFTTKPKGRGTGLGLATCAVVLKHYGGAIQFDTRIGLGTTFSVLLPEIQTAAPNLDFQFDDEPGVGTEIVLLVEDDEAIRSVTSAILRSLGYQIHAVGGGREALDYVESENPQIDLLLTDIVMPAMGGRELAERLLTKRPDLRVLFMSGYVDDPVILHAVQEASIPFLEKPFTRDGLAKKVREALDTPRNAVART